MPFLDILGYFTEVNIGYSTLGYSTIKKIIWIFKYYFKFMLLYYILYYIKLL
jgi:hypothetical protein